MSSPTPSDSVANTARPALWQCGRFRLSLERPLVMGILNVTDDSFSDGGRHRDPTVAVAAARRMIDEGADIIDIGAESTRPGAQAVPPDEEWARLAPVVEALAGLDVPLSIDTRHPGTMARVIAAGASIINDISGFRTLEARAAVAGCDVGLVTMHMLGDSPATMQANPVYADVVAEVGRFLMDSRQALLDAGVAPERICLDPEFGFGKTLAHNLAHPVERRLAASLAGALAGVQMGATIVRVHDVPETVQALAVWTAIGLPAAAGSVHIGDGHSGRPAKE